MSDTLSTIGNFFSGTVGKGLLGAGLGGVGLLQNLIAYKQQQDKLNTIKGYINNPATMAAKISQLEKPLSAGLVADISRQTDAYGAERGLGSSPYIMKDVLAQSLAPAELQQQQAAQNAFLSALSAYGGAPTMPPANMSGLFQALMMGKNPATPSTGSDTGNWNMAPNWSGGNTAPFPMPLTDVGAGTFSDFGTMPGITSSAVPS